MLDSLSLVFCSGFYDMEMQMDQVLDQEATTRLVTDLTFIGAGPAAIAELQGRLDRLTDADNRIIIGEIKTDSEGRPICGLSFNCDSYNPPTKDEFGDMQPDPRAVADLQKLLSDHVNFDGCASWRSINLLTQD